jgi:hypothetical protein
MKRISDSYPGWNRRIIGCIRTFKAGGAAFWACYCFLLQNKGRPYRKQAMPQFDSERHPTCP